MQHLNCMSTSAYFVHARVGLNTNAVEHSQGKQIYKYMKNDISFIGYESGTDCPWRKTRINL